MPYQDLVWMPYQALVSMRYQILGGMPYRVWAELRYPAASEQHCGTRPIPIAREPLSRVFERSSVFRAQ